MGAAANAGRGSSIQRRISIGFAVMTLLVVCAGVAGLAFTLIADRASSAVRLGIAAQNHLHTIRSSWQECAVLLDEAAALPRGGQSQVDQLAASYQARFTSLEQAMDELHTRPPGANAAARQQNQIILEVMAQNTAALKLSGEEFLRLAGQPASEPAEIQQARASRILPLQHSLNQNLGVLQGNIQEDIHQALADAERMHSLATLAWSGLALFGAALGIFFTVYFTRSIVRPIQELAQAMQRVTSRDFSPLQPNPRQDELGEVWASLALLTDWLRGKSAPSSADLQRTRELERRSTQMQVAAEVARDASSVQNLDALLSNAVELIRGRFGFYHTGIFLNDPRGEYTILQAATGDAGRRMLSSGHRLQIGEVGIVGNVAHSGKPRIAVDVGADSAAPDAVNNPLLPATRSEMALPLKIGERVTGVLDVHSQFANAFSQEDVGALQILADQLAVAIENARLINDYQESLRELESVYLRLSRGAWADIKRSRVNSGYMYDHNGIKPVGALQEFSAPAGEDPSSAEPDGNEIPEAAGVPAGLRKVEIPLTIRGSRIGSLEIWLQESQYNAHVEYFLQQLSPRLSQSLETARLYQETQERAARERMVGDISGRLRETLNVDSVLRTAAEEIRNALGLNDLTIRLGGAEPQPSKNGGAGGNGK